MVTGFKMRLTFHHPMICFAAQKKQAEPGK